MKEQNRKSLEIISLGLGVQSTAIYLQSSIGELPRADYAIFADPGKEKKRTVEYLNDFLLPWSEKNNGIPIIIADKENLYTDLLSYSAGSSSEVVRFAPIPAFTRNDDGTTGMLRRQCTNEYKIEQVDAAIRELYNAKPYERLPPTRVWKGITLDEITRMSIPTDAWKIHYYPYVGYTIGRKFQERDKEVIGKTRVDLYRWYERMGFPIPPKSSCVFCPYQSEPVWAKMKREDPEDFEAACIVDDAIRNSTKKGFLNPVYLHDSLVPLREIVFKEDGADLWKGDCQDECHI